MQPAQSPKGTPLAAAWVLMLCRGCLKMLGNVAFECVFYKLGWKEHFPGAWGHFSVWSSFFLPPAPHHGFLSTCFPPLLLRTCLSSHLPALPLTAARPLGQPFGPAGEGGHPRHKHTEEQGQVSGLGSSGAESGAIPSQGEGGDAPGHADPEVGHVREGRVMSPVGPGLSFSSCSWPVLHSGDPAKTQIRSPQVKRLITVWTPSSAIPENQHLLIIPWTSQQALMGSSFTSTLETRRGIVIIIPAWLDVINIFERRM